MAKMVNFVTYNYHNKNEKKKDREIYTILTLTKRKGRISALIFD